ncbi:hypothetical protein ANCDUO_12672 [Ancylostoma duodenale]|uniref:Tc1-like transposase DDE domain-containing protein n=1 Tax=Ancylostoma duodenale TaxID=51022 RepID=A0A0C2CKT8_9BILA|nr:hypothetical protein ANCDUO_12672 [Ancylostoma duodenale]
MEYQHIFLPLRRQGKSIRCITAEIKKHDDTITYYAVRWFIREFDNYSSQKRKEYKPRLYGAQFDQIKSVIEDCYSRDSSTTCKEIANTSMMQKIHISASQIQRYRCNIGFKRTTTKYCYTIREQNKVAREVFAQDMIAKNESFFFDCIFTDECTVQIDYNTRFYFVREGDSFARLRSRAKHPGKVHVWEGISSRGASQIAILSGNTRINSEYYCRYARLVQDNAPPHISAYTRQQLQDWNVEVLKWPAESPDLNPIELVWDTCQKYIIGIKRRLRRVVKRGGGNIMEGRETSSDFEGYNSEEDEQFQR